MKKFENIFLAGGKQKKPPRDRRLKKSKNNMKLSRLLERIEVLRHTGIVDF